MLSLFEELDDREEEAAENDMEEKSEHLTSGSTNCRNHLSSASRAPGWLFFLGDGFLRLYKRYNNIGYIGLFIGDFYTMVACLFLILSTTPVIVLLMGFKTLYTNPWLVG